MESTPTRLRRTAASWALIGVSAAGIVGAAALTCDEAVRSETTGASAVGDGLTSVPRNGPARSSSTTTSVAPSYSPGIHTRSHGS